MKIAEILIPVVSVFVAAFVGQPIIYFTNLILRRKLKKIENALESLKLFETYETKFKNDFIIPDIKETYFYIQTGIETNEKSIEKYINFKNELSGNYTWKQIKTAHSYLILNTENIEIRINKIERNTANIFKIIALILITIFPILLMIYNYILPTESLKLEILILTSFASGFCLVYFINPILIAKGMEKKLKRNKQ